MQEITQPTDLASAVAHEVSLATALRDFSADSASPKEARADARPTTGNVEAPDAFFPREPNSLQESGLTESDVEALALKALLHFELATGRRIAEQLKLPFGIVQGVLQELKRQLFVVYKASAPMSDYEYELTTAGLERAHRFNKRCTYFGAAPVAMNDYVESVRQQSVRRERPTLANLRQAFSDLMLTDGVISQLGQAVNAGRSLFLYGAPGNGKTSIAERIIRGVGQSIWIPHTVTIGGEIIRLYDPASHEEMPLANDGQLLSQLRVDRRWVRIRRPAVVVGGELTMEHLEITHNAATGISELPVHLKSNCGALVIDDFGRQRISTTELLNRWIIPLERGYDHLSLPSGRQLKIPFNQLLVFATNAEPNTLVDEAFLRRIPYKIEVSDPTEDQFRALFQRLATTAGCKYRDDAASYLIEHHFTEQNRQLRFCHARDLLEQVQNYCEFHDQPFELTKQTVDVAVNNYFAGL